jgi:hypothetical protein
MANTTYASHAVVQQDAGNDFLHYVTASGAPLFTVNNSGNLSTVGGVAGTGLGAPVIAYGYNAAVGFGVFNTAAAVTMVAAATANAGIYRLSYQLIITTSFVTNTELTLAFGWTDADQATTLTLTTAAKTAGAYLPATSGGTITASTLQTSIFSSTGAAAITWTPNVTGSAATAGVAQVSIVLERLV